MYTVVEYVAITTILYSTKIRLVRIYFLQTY